MNDLKIAQLLQNSGFIAVTALSLALGIGSEKEEQFKAGLHTTVNFFGPFALAQEYQ